MSGSGRKSQYRKSVTSNFLNQSVVPVENEEIVIVTANRGSNLFEIQLSNGNIELAKLPNKFNKLIWIKKNDYLIVENNAEKDAESAAGSKVKYAVVNIINKENIKTLKSDRLWPVEFTRENVVDGGVIDKDDLMPGYDETDESWEEEYDIDSVIH